MRLLCLGFSRQGYWSGLPFPSLGDLSDSGIKPRSPALTADFLPSEPPGKPNQGKMRQLLLLLLLCRSVVPDSSRPHGLQPTRLLCPWDFSRQEYWNGVPLPSPMHESEVTQSCPTLSNPMDCSLPGSSVHGIFQARVLEWGAIAFSN